MKRQEWKDHERLLRDMKGIDLKHYNPWQDAHSRQRMPRTQRIGLIGGILLLSGCILLVALLMELAR